MLHLNACDLSETSREYLLSVLLDPQYIIDLVTKRFELHLKDLKQYEPKDCDSINVRSTIDLLSKDLRLIFELRHSITDLLKDCEVKVFSDDYLKSAETRLDSALKLFKKV